ncbi:MAG TPA: hypothetical protein P5079_02505 [Elusimicrobiota bacterium]|nr:hypothetical protein [Elusimicrobiota bacterium]
MVRTRSRFFKLLFVPTALLAAAALLAADGKHQKFLSQKQEIFVLAGERVRSAHYDFQRTLKMGEDRLRELHENYKVSGSTPPTALDQDVMDLRTATQQVRLRRARGRVVPENPEAAGLVKRYWEEYKSGYEGLQKDILVHRRVGTPESQVYWDIVKRYDDLRSQTEKNLIYNTPPGRASLDEVVQKDRWQILKAVESPNVKTRNKVIGVVAPEEHPRQVNVDVAPFYHSQGYLPTISPDRIGAYSIPKGHRSVTQREAGLKIILRVSKGKGVAYIGSSEKELNYGYLLIPPDTAYYIENVGDDNLDIEYIVLSSS